ncbi:MAG: hypothetical protein J6A25_13545 [Lachnospiraceae bacterium]|nr:hypothetical protein [Lachnospiraceae bacterium]
MIHRFLFHDINEGLIRHAKRYVLVVIVVVITCSMIDSMSAYFMDYFGEYWSPIEYGINEFYGRYPFVFDINSTDKFTIPFGWVLIYLFLAYMIGDYIYKDMNGYGMYMMIKSKKRWYWWISKCLWCVAVNVFYFGLLWISNIAYSWMKHGDIAFYQESDLRMSYYGFGFDNMGMPKLLLVVIVMPLLVGIVQSILQITLTLIFNSVATMTIIAGILMLSCYYGSIYIPHSYAMLIRYFSNESDPDFVAVDAGTGIAVLGIGIVAMVVMGYMIFRKKNVISNR